MSEGRSRQQEIYLALLFVAELDLTLGLSGCTSIAELSREHVQSSG
jgi:hypothetical protein